MRVWSALAGIVAMVGAVMAAPAAQAQTSSGNLIVNGDAEAGYCTTDWNAATTLPGWSITSGSPDVICSSAGSFTYPSSPTPGKAFFAPGNQGDGAIAQTVNVASAASAIDGGGVTYNLEGWLGGWGSYAGQAQVAVTFLNGSGQSVGSGALPTVSASDRKSKNAFLDRKTSAAVPKGTRSIAVQVKFVNSAHEAGYFDNLSLTLSTPVAAAALTPPASTVPGYDHVFVIMMENTDYSAIAPDTTDMPYFHGLLGKGASMTNYHAVYHPSDENYMAIAGGDTYAVGATYWPNIKDPNQNLGDELEAAGKGWKAYEQGMGAPCNASAATEHNKDQYYAPDDAPFINFTNISGNAARCAAHLVDTDQMATDLASTATTPAFSWIGADDYYDGESAGNGNAASRKVQDGWLQQTIDPILSSPAWTQQRSLLIVTWDEDLSEADNHVATVLVGSQGTVPAAITSNARYDHYSTGRTIEAALGLGALTANDKYATPMNDAFAH
ncbi:alkaline phosphatase family protein [Nocardia sp. NPDC059240]|uniref:alkaline phosphatase family protein n=1 Tax=Nocardia sp. NPDC059240 TaxID=3346786 RepID=UPI00368D60D6